MKQNFFKNVWLRVAVIVAVVTTAFAGTAWATDGEYSITDSYPGWTFSNINFTNGVGVPTGNATIVTGKIEFPSSIYFNTTKPNGNKASGTWTVEVSTDGSDWKGLASASCSVGQELTVLLNNLYNVYIRLSLSNPKKPQDTTIKEIKLTTHPIEDPVITLAPTFVGSTTATIACASDDATIKYSLDNGSTWNNYPAGGVTISESSTIYAKAVRYYTNTIIPQNNVEGSSNVVSATTKEYARTTVSTYGYATYCFNKALDFTGSDVTAYVATLSGRTLTYTQINKVPAGTGILLSAPVGATTPVDVPVIASEEAETVTDNCLIGVTEETMISEDAYILSVNTDDVIGFYRAGSYNRLGANRAYIASVAGVKAFAIDFEDDATAIQTIDNGQLTTDGAIFNLAGQRMGKMQKGINIVNGKKILK